MKRFAYVCMVVLSCWACATQSEQAGVISKAAVMEECEYFPDDISVTSSTKFVLNNSLDIVVTDKSGAAINGILCLLYESGEIMGVANFKSGRTDGYSKMYYESGQLQAESNYKAGQLDGVGKVYYESGQVKQEASYKAGQLDGYGKEYYESGQLKSEASYKAGQFDGAAKGYYESGQLQVEGNYKAGQFDKLLRVYKEDGKLDYEAIYEEGQLVSLCRTTTIYDNGMREEAACKNGKREGAALLYHAKGALFKELFYENDKQEGIGKEYDERGRLLLTTRHKNGVVVSGVCADGRELTKAELLNIENRIMPTCGQ